MERRQNDLLQGIPLSQQILSTALTMVGFCTTLIGLVKVAENSIGPSHVDEYSASILQIFLASAGLAYWSLRTRKPKLSNLLQYFADRLLIVGLVSISVIASFFAYNLI